MAVPDSPPPATAVIRYLAVLSCAAGGQRRPDAAR